MAGAVEKRKATLAAKKAAQAAAEQKLGVSPSAAKQKPKVPKKDSPQQPQQMDPAAGYVQTMPSMGTFSFSANP